MAIALSCLWLFSMACMAWCYATAPEIDEA